MGLKHTSAIKKLLASAGCKFVRHGKGDHEIWISPITNKNFPVDGTITSHQTGKHRA